MFLFLLIIYLKMHHHHHLHIVTISLFFYLAVRCVFDSVRFLCSISSLECCHAVAVVKSGTTFQINDLRGKKSCHSCFQSYGGWNIPMGRMVADNTISWAGSDDMPLDKGQCGYFIIVQIIVKRLSGILTFSGLIFPNKACCLWKLCLWLHYIFKIRGDHLHTVILLVIYLQWQMNQNSCPLTGIEK